MSQPLAYFISFTCKGARLHGDPRGTVDREQNTHGDEFLSPNRIRVISEAETMGRPPFCLTPAQWDVVGSTIRAVADYRGWTLHGLAVRTNHVHVVVSASGVLPEPVMEDFKAYSARRLREAGLLTADVKPWTRHGSAIYLWKAGQVAAAVDYVVERQDDRDWHPSS